MKTAVVAWLPRSSWPTLRDILFWSSTDLLREGSDTPTLIEFLDLSCTQDLFLPFEFQSYFLFCTSQVGASEKLNTLFRLNEIIDLLYTGRFLLVLAGLAP